LNKLTASQSRCLPDEFTDTIQELDDEGIAAHEESLRMPNFDVFDLRDRVQGGGNEEYNDLYNEDKPSFG